MVGCIFAMVIWPAFRMGQYRDDDHQEDASHFILGRKRHFRKTTSFDRNFDRYWPTKVEFATNFRPLKYKIRRFGFLFGECLKYGLREISKHSFLSLNCYFSEITKMIIWVNSWIFSGKSRKSYTGIGWILENLGISFVISPQKIDLGSFVCKLGRVFPMVIRSEFRLEEV